jgi:hypothetical protein
MECNILLFPLSPETNQDGYFQAKQFVESNCGIGTHAMVDEDDGQKAGSYGRMIGLYSMKDWIFL